MDISFYLRLLAEESLVEVSVGGCLLGDKLLLVEFEIVVAEVGRRCQGLGTYTVKGCNRHSFVERSAEAFRQASLFS